MHETSDRSLASAVPAPGDITVAALVRRVVFAGLLLGALTILASIAIATT